MVSGMFVLPLTEHAAYSSLFRLSKKHVRSQACLASHCAHRFCSFGCLPALATGGCHAESLEKCYEIRAKAAGVATPLACTCAEKIIHCTYLCRRVYAAPKAQSFHALKPCLESRCHMLAPKTSLAHVTRTDHMQHAKCLAQRLDNNETKHAVAQFLARAQLQLTPFPILFFAAPAGENVVSFRRKWTQSKLCG